MKRQIDKDEVYTLKIKLMFRSKYLTMGKFERLDSRRGRTRRTGEYKKYLGSVARRGKKQETR